MQDVKSMNEVSLKIVLRCNLVVLSFNSVHHMWNTCISEISEIVLITDNDSIIFKYKVT